MFEGSSDRPAVEVQRFNWFGEKSRTGYANDGADTDPQDRALNRYLNDDYEVAQCPLDKGDALTQGGAYLAYEKYGTSYEVGDRDPAGGQKTGQFGFWFPEAHRESEIRVPTKKILMKDLVSQFDRKDTEFQHQWHNAMDPLRVSAYFADGHGDSVDRKMDTEAVPAHPGNVGNRIDQWAHNTDYY